MITYRTTDMAKWGAGSGANLSASQIDANFYDLQQAIQAVAPVNGVGVSSVSLIGDQLKFTLTDNTIFGPFTLPTATFKARGLWVASQSYDRNDIITAGGSVYVVNAAHTSGATFNPGAGDGAGADYYGLLFTPPDHQVPAGGNLGQVVTKTGSSDYVYGWRDILALPSGGSAGQALKKASSTAGDASWVNINEVPAGGAAGQALVKSSATDFDAAWANIKDVASVSISTTGGATTADVNSANGDVFRIMAAADITVTHNSATQSKPIWVILASDGTARTVTFGPQFKTSGTLSLPADATKSFVVSFIPFGAAFFECARSAALS